MCALARQLQGAIGQIHVQLGQIGEAQLRREHPLAHVADLVLDLALLPARSGRAGRGLDQVVIAHRQEAAVVAPLPAGEDRIDGGLEVVVDPAPGHAAQERERPGVRVEHHLLALARIGDQEERAAVTQPQMTDLDHLLDAAEHHMLVAPVELVGLAGCKALWDERRRHRPPRPLERAHVTAHAVDRAAVALQAQRLVHPLRRALLARRAACSRPPATHPASPDTGRASAAAGASADTRTPRPRHAAPA